MPASSTHLDCETKCNATQGCVGYVFANASCVSKPDGMCWTKGAVPLARNLPISRKLFPYILCGLVFMFNILKGRTL